MTDYMNQPLDELKAAVIADGVIDADEADGLRRRLYADGVIDREEADFLFAVNDAVSGADNDPAWQTLFVEALTSHVLEDEASPGEIDEDEADWLIQCIEGDGQIDANEKALLASIKSKASAMPDRLRKMIEPS